MKYHNNDVVFSLSQGYKIVSGSYTITEFNITKSQDPNNEITVNRKFNCNSNGRFTFRVGRKGSSAVADWFNNRIFESSNTFGHKAGKLNFAFIGTLELKITGGILGGRWETYRFNDIALAQGHSGATNNWWFGGRHCTNIGNNKVWASGTNSIDQSINFIYSRGGNDYSTVLVLPSKLIETKNWMSKINNTRTLNDIVMPGCHDAGMSEVHHCQIWAQLDIAAVKTQETSIGNQLILGARYFDIRVDYDHNELVTYHREGKIGCNGQSLQAILEQVSNFLKSNATETAIFKVSHIRNISGHDEKDTKNRITELLDRYSKYIYMNDSPDINLAYVKIEDVRGKIILLFDYEENINTKKGYFRYKDYGNHGANMIVYDKYSNNIAYEVMKKDQLNKWNEYGGLGKNYLFLLSWTLTTGIASIEQHARLANAKLPSVLYERIVENKNSKPNIIFVDFINDYFAQAIIQYNFIKF